MRFPLFTSLQRRKEGFTNILDHGRTADHNFGTQAMLGQASGIQVHSIMSNIINRLSILIALSSFWAPSVQAEQPLRAGAYVQDVTGSFDSYIVSGGFTERRRGKMNPGDLKARCFVLQRGKLSIAVAIVDSCMIPRTVCDEAKKLASKATGIPTDRILIAATHTHSAPSVMKMN